MKYDRSFKCPESLSDRNLQKILFFYLLECPVEGKSYRGKTFTDFGYHGSSAFSKLKKNLLDAATDSLRRNYYPSQN